MEPTRTRIVEIAVNQLHQARCPRAGHNLKHRTKP
jgi:hypothetical protein